jgi:malate dehydrogenase (oxaloacetate-decarboxylating)
MPVMRATTPWFEIVREGDGEVMVAHVDGIALLRFPLSNKGTAFTPEERVELGLDGLLPPAVNTLQQQVERAYRSLSMAPTPLARYQLLRSMQERHEVLFFAVLAQHLEELLPVVYTPTVGEAVQRFSALYQHPRGLSFSPDNVGRAASVCANYPLGDVRMIVATDSSAILGIGDQGYGGLAIPIGKLALYTVGGGVSPFHTLPVALDVGTDRADLVADPEYLGVRRERLRGDAYLEFVDRFVAGVRSRWPRAVLQWEDLAKDTAFAVLERYREALPSFNDDIQGTGAMALAGVLGACRLRGQTLAEQRIVIHGAGAGGVGVAWALWQGLMAEGLSEDEAASRLFLLDSRGLLVEGRQMEEYKRRFAQRAGALPWPASAAPGLLETVAGARATVLIGLSGQARAFDERVVRAVSGLRPVIFSLSNPTSITEALPADVMEWTSGRAIVATGSPFPGVPQGNNAFIFPGLGFGSICSGARMISDGMVLESARALADYTAAHHLTDGRVYPPVSELFEVSVAVAARVWRQATREGLAAVPVPVDAEAAVRARAWKPAYLPCRRAKTASASAA